MRLSGSSAIVTGASGGIGSALVDELTAAGVDVLAVSRHPRPGSRLREGVTDGQGRRIPCAADITSSLDRQRLLREARALSRPPALLVHAAASPGFALLEDTSDELAERLFRTHVLAPLALTRDLLPLLAEQPRAAVVAVGSTFGSIGFPGFAAYSASKFALRGLFEALGREHADGAVRFQWLSPRATATAFNSPQVVALNEALKVSVDDPRAVARQLLQAIQGGRRRLQIGWPEKLFVRINGLLPALVDRALAGQLAAVRQHARIDPPAPAEGILQ